MPQHGGAYATCLSRGVQQFTSPAEYGQDITAEVLQSSGAIMRYNIAGKSRSALSHCYEGLLEDCCRTWPRRHQQAVLNAVSWFSAPALAISCRFRFAHASQDRPGSTSRSNINFQRRQPQLLATFVVAATCGDMITSMLSWHMHGIYLLSTAGVPAGALVGDEVEAETALLKADGTVQLPASSAVFGASGSQALSVWPLAGSSADLRQGGQVTALLT